MKNGQNPYILAKNVRKCKENVRLETRTSTGIEPNPYILTLFFNFIVKIKISYIDKLF